MSLLQAVPPAPPLPPPIPLDPNLAISQFNGPAAVMIVLLICTAMTIILWPLARALGRRLEGKGTTAALQGELDQMQHRLAEVDVLHQRVAELEERLDFAERLLARGDPQATLPRSTS